ncbi:MAG: bifunctional ornithine acetyltransferase/N-acetylglutamate synthase [Rickettsiaceae bacterium]|jgi:glutamate N-acetyltransferase/amino-acid N-acetyltransferase|nr:bifunctional ornithine acetyltransferase/N-acetylglutamate synthase [Rickettsiaceae bacterium]
MEPIKNIKLATINCGLKYKNRDDLLLVQLPEQSAVAGVFTKSSTAAAPVRIGQQNLQKTAPNTTARALIVNAGNANAFTGAGGLEAVNRVAAEVAKIIGCEQNQVFMSSTGVIGERLKDELIIAALPDLSKKLSDDKEAWQNSAKAIMTTDTFAKFSSKTISIEGKKVTINGFAKGSGMIAPNMATMLGYIFTDANISAAILQKLLSELTEETFNSITVDSDTSTNDTVLLFSTKQADHTEINDIGDKNLSEFKAVLKDLMLELAKLIVIDGEGATKLIEVEVAGASSKAAAKTIALAIANSPLVKTAIAGADPNWGRIVMAIGKSEQKVVQEKLSIRIGDFTIVENGERINGYDEKPVHQYMTGKEVKIFVDMNLAEKENRAIVWTCDFTEGYIKINKDYRS